MDENERTRLSLVLVRIVLIVLFIYLFLLLCSWGLWKELFLLIMDMIYGQAPMCLVCIFWLICLTFDAFFFLIYSVLVEKGGKCVGGKWKGGRGV